MCIGLPKAPKVPVAPERQAEQLPQDMTQSQSNDIYKRRRKGLWASIFTSPAGVSGPPTVTGGTGGVTGG